MVYYRLFANNMGMFIRAIETTFHEAMDVIAIYERASGEKLNVAKSIVISFGLPVIPLWLLNLGCFISSPRVIHIYIWVPLGDLTLVGLICLTSILIALVNDSICGQIKHSRS